MTSLLEKHVALQNADASSLDGGDVALPAFFELHETLFDGGDADALSGAARVRLAFAAFGGALYIAKDLRKVVANLTQLLEALDSVAQVEKLAFRECRRA